MCGEYLSTCWTGWRRHNITFIKWDMNRNVSEPGWPDAPGDARESMGALRGRRLPRVEYSGAAPSAGMLWQSCSGGGGRVDYGMLRMVDQFWVSDNTEATKRGSASRKASQLMPAITMESQVTHMGRPLCRCPSASTSA